MYNTTIYKAILQELKTIIQEHRHARNHKLPSERALSAKFSATRPTVRTAYQHLIAQGLVVAVHGKGYFIKTDESPHPKNDSLRAQVLFVAPTMKTNFMQQLYAGIANFCEANEVELSVKLTEDSEKKEKKLLESVPYSSYDGVILFPVDNEYYNEPLLKLSIAKYPTVIIDRYIKTLNLSFVSTDNQKAMADVVKYLHQKKYKNLVFAPFDPSIATTMEERINGYNNGLLKYYGRTLASNTLTLKSNNKDYIYNVIKSFLTEHPETDALIISDSCLPIAKLAISELNIRTPEDLRIVIFDNEISFADQKQVHPYIIEQEGEKIGYFAAACLHGQILGNRRIISKKFPVKIIDTDT